MNTDHELSSAEVLSLVVAVLTEMTAEAKASGDHGREHLQTLAEFSNRLSEALSYE